MQSLASAEPAAAAAPVDHQALPNQQEHLQPSEKQDFISNKSPSEANTVEQNSQTEIPRIDVTALPHQNRPNLQQMKQSAAFNFNSTLNPSRTASQSLSCILARTLRTIFSFLVFLNFQTERNFSVEPQKCCFQLHFPRF